MSSNIERRWRQMLSDADGPLPSNSKQSNNNMVEGESRQFGFLSGAALPIICYPCARRKAEEAETQRGPQGTAPIEETCGGHTLFVQAPTGEEGNEARSICCRQGCQVRCFVLLCAKAKTKVAEFQEGSSTPSDQRQTGTRCKYGAAFVNRPVPGGTQVYEGTQGFACGIDAAASAY